MTLAEIGARVLQPFVDELDRRRARWRSSRMRSRFQFPSSRSSRHLRARAVPRPDAGLQGRRRARDGAAHGRACSAATTRSRFWWPPPATPAAPSRTPFTRCPHTRVVILYPKGRISPTQEAQLTMFNGEATNVRAYAAAGSFDDCQRLTKTAFADPVLSRRANLTSANSINIGRLLPQMIYYAHAVGQLAARGSSRVLHAERELRKPHRRADGQAAGLADRPVCRRHQRQRRRAAVSGTGRFEPRPSIHTVANAMDVGNPSNFDRLIVAVRRRSRRHPPRRHRQPPRRRRGAGDDPKGLRRAWLPARSAQRDCLSGAQEVSRRGRRQAGPAAGVFLATAHPAKFAEIVEPVIGRAIEKPKPLVEALATEAHDSGDRRDTGGGREGPCLSTCIGPTS